MIFLPPDVSRSLKETLANVLPPAVSRSLALAFMLFLLPLALSLTGLWQLQKARADLDKIGNSANAARIAELKTLKRQALTSWQSVKVEVNGVTLAGPAAASAIQQEIERLSHVSPNARPISHFANLAVISGGAALVLGLSGLVLAVVSGRLARRSRADLMSIFSLARRSLPFLLAGAVLLLTLSLVGLTGAHGLHVLDLINDGHPSRGTVKGHFALLLFAAAAVAVGLSGIYNLRKSFAAFVGDPIRQHGRAVSQQDAPGLWRHVGELADRLKARPPQNIVVGLTDGFYVTAHDIELLPEGRRLSGETLYLPLSHAALLRPDEFDAIVGHELGHFSGADTAYTLRFVPMHAGMLRSLALLEEAGGFTTAPARLLGEFLMEQVHHAVMHWDREREFAADAAGKQVAGSRASARALVRSSAVQPVISDFLDQVARRPEDASSDLLEALVAEAQQRGLQDPRLDQQSATPHPTDSHPPTVQRLQALGEPLTPELVAEACGRVDRRGLMFLHAFFADRLALQRQLSADIAQAMLSHKQEVKAELQQWVEEAGPPIEVHERVWPTVLALSIGSLVLAGVSVGCVLAGMKKNDPGLMWIALGAFVLGLLCSGWTLGIVLRSQRAAFTLSSHGLSSEYLSALLPWALVDNVEMTTINRTACHIMFYLDKQVDPAKIPKLIRRSWWMFIYTPRNRLMKVMLNGLKGISPEDLYEAIQRNRRAAHASDVLAGM